MTNVATSLVSILFNWQLLRFAGEDGVAAYGAMMYISMIFGAFFFGYSMGIVPVISYKYGAGDRQQLHLLYTRSIRIVLVISLAMFAFGELAAPFLAHLFTGYDPALYAMTVEAFHICSFCFLAAGLAIFGSSFFTVLNNGLVSALISFLRTLVFQTACVLILPELLQITGIWLSVPIAEFLAAAAAVFLLRKYRKQYGY